jgi:immune inhibitor A
MSSGFKWVAAILVVGIVLACCCLIGLTVVGGLTFLTIRQSSLVPDAAPQPAVEFMANFSPKLAPYDYPIITPVPNGQYLPAQDPAEESQWTLERTLVTESSLPGLASRLLDAGDVQSKLSVPPRAYQLGDAQDFWVSNADNAQAFQVQACLSYITDHAYFWVEDGIQYQHADLAALAETFETQIYPTDRDFFGNEWTPGVDNDPHLYVLYVRNAGASVAGYFSSVDEATPGVHEYSNAHEMFIFNADTTLLDEEYTYSVLAHEFQHMIQYNQDRNEDTWLNEGFSELAIYLNGFDLGGLDLQYLYNTDLQLNTWPEVNEPSGSHYGASYLFVRYFYDRFGADLTRQLVDDPLNGLWSVDAILSANDLRDASSSVQLTADDVFADWAVANYLQDPAVGDGRYAYGDSYDQLQAATTESIPSCPVDWQPRSVAQYGVDYIQVDCPGSYTLQFEGDPEVSVWPVDAHSGDYAFWSNRGDESDMRLTRTFDLRTASGPLQLSYWTWYDLEEDYDYAYVEASTDGEHWDILQAPSSTLDDPSGNSFGWAYNGQSGGWIQEQVDLSSYAGKLVSVRFEYVTDSAVNGVGMLIDDLNLQGGDYHEDFENGAAGWQAEGWARIQNRLPQEYAVSLIWSGQQGTRVETVHVLDGQNFERQVTLGDGYEQVVLVVSGLNRYTTIPADYRFRLQTLH